MRTLKRNKQKVWYWLLAGETEIKDSNGLRTGEYQKTYEAPKLLMANFSPATGNANIEPFGVNAEYSHVILIAGKSDIKEDTLVWLGDDPSTAAEGFYRVVRVAESLNHTRIAIRETEYTAPYTGESDGGNDNG